MYFFQGKITSYGTYQELEGKGDEILVKANAGGEDVDSLTSEAQESNTTENTVTSKIVKSENFENSDQKSRASGNIGLKTYLKYFTAANRSFQFSWHVLMFIISQVFITVIEYWVVLW